MGHPIFEQAIKKYHEDVTSGSFVPRRVLSPKRYDHIIVFERLILDDSERRFTDFINTFRDNDRFYFGDFVKVPQCLVLDGRARDGEKCWVSRKGFDNFFGDGLLLEVYLENAKYQLSFLNPKFISSVKKNKDFEFHLPEPNGKYIDGVAVEYELIDVVMENGEVCTLNSSVDSFLKTLHG